jgi:hypothetical protein
MNKTQVTMCVFRQPVQLLQLLAGAALAAHKIIH